VLHVCLGQCIYSASETQQLDHLDPHLDDSSSICEIQFSVKHLDPHLDDSSSICKILFSVK